MRKTVTEAEPEGWADDLDHPFPSARNVLTQEEIAALLRPDLPDDLPIPPEPQSVTPRAPAIFEEEAAPPQRSPLETEYADLGARLSRALAEASGIKAALSPQSCAHTAPSEIISAMSGKVGAVACFGRSDLGTQALVCLSPELADAIIAMACGAQGSTGRIGDGWRLSAIDCALLEQLLSGFSALFEEGTELQAIETDLPYVMSLMPHEAPAFGAYRVEAPGLHTQLFVIAAPRAQPLQTPIDAAPMGAPVTAVLTARVASLSVPLSHLTSLKAGSTLLLGLPADQPVQVLSGGRDGPVAFEGEIGRKGNHMAVRISQKRRAVLKGD